MTAGRQEANVGVQVMTAGGATKKAQELMAQTQTIMSDDQEVEIDVGYAYRHLTPEHKTNVDKIIGWGSTINLLAGYAPDSLVEFGFQNLVLPILRMSEGVVAPGSMEEVAMKGLGSLSAGDIRHFLRILKELDFSQAEKQPKNPLQDQLFDLLKKLEDKRSAIQEGLDIQEVKGLSSFEGLNQGIYAMKGNAILPNEQKQRICLVYIRSAEKSAALMMVRLGRTPENKKGDLIPVPIAIDSDSVDRFMAELRKFNVYKLEDMTVYSVTPL